VVTLSCALLLYGVVATGVVFLVVLLGLICLVHGWTCLDGISLKKVGWVFPPFGVFPG
jgi:hypothetical protein